MALAAGFFVPGPIRVRRASPRWCWPCPSLWFFAFFGDGDGGRGDLRGVYLLTARLLPRRSTSWRGPKGRAIFLAGALLFFASWLPFEVAGSDSDSLIPFQSEISSSSSSTDFGLIDRRHTAIGRRQTPPTRRPRSRSSSGVVFLGVGAVLDRRG